MISIVIPAYNEEKLIAHCLDSLVRQQTAEAFEVIIVDNGSTDRTLEIVRTYKRKLQLRLISLSVRGRGAARNAGFQRARGEIIASTDADAIVPPSWVDTMVAVLRTGNGIAVTGPGHISDMDPITNFLHNLFQPVSMRLYRLIIGHYWLTGYNFAVNKSAYERSGGFNPRLNAAEDIDLTWRIRVLGDIIFVPLSVHISGRRYRNGLLAGVTAYTRLYLRYLFSSEKQAALSDIR